MHAYIHTQVCIVDMHIRVCLFMKINMSTHVYLYGCSHTCVYVYMYIHIYIYTCLSIFAYIYICMHTHTYIYIYIYIYLFIHLFLRVLTFSGKIWENRATMGRESGIEESLFMQMQGQCSDTILAIFRNTYGKRSGSVGGGGGDYERMCIYMAC